MISEKIARELDKLEMILNRRDGDVYLIGASIIETLRAETDRVRGLEENAVLVNPFAQEEAHASC